MVCKIICCSEFPEIPDKAGRKTGRRRRTQAIAKRYAFHANAVTNNETNGSPHWWDQNVIFLN